MKILVADDDRMISATIEAAIKKHFECELVMVSNGTAALEALRDPESPKIVILDWMMPGLTGPEICRIVKHRDGSVDPYIIMVTSMDTKADILEAMDAGADEYLFKPIDYTELRARIRAGFKVIELRESLAASIASLRELRNQSRQ